MTDEARAEGAMRRLYIAGPDVFSKDALALGAAKKALCARYGYEGLFPLDNSVDPALGELERRRAIFAGNVGLMEACDAILANVTPFKGFDCDPGTAFEVGYCYARGKPIILYSAFSDSAEARQERLLRLLGPGASAVEPFFRFEQFEVEGFSLGANLMLIEAALEGGGAFVEGESEDLADLALFERALLAVSAFARGAGHTAGA